MRRAQPDVVNHDYAPEPILPPRNSDKMCLVAYLVNQKTQNNATRYTLETGRELHWVGIPHTHDTHFTKINADQGDVAHRQRDDTYWLYWHDTWTGPFPNRGAITAAVQLLL